MENVLLNDINGMKWKWSSWRREDNEAWIMKKFWMNAEYEKALYSIHICLDGCHVQLY